jgi:hypothetical protein
VARITRTYGLPYKGYLGAMKAFDCPLDYAAEGSSDMLYHPANGSFVRRGGMTIKGDTAPSNANEVTGLLESKCSMRDRQLAELDSPSLTDGAQTHSVLFTKDFPASGSTYSDEGVFGQLYFRSTNTNTNQVCGKSFSATHYPAPSSATPNFMCVPLWYSSGGSAGGLTRLNTLLARRFHCPGSRRFLDVGDWRHFPSFFGTPSKWNRRFNDSDSTAENEQHFLSGPVPPLVMPTVTFDATESTTGAWRNGQRFYISVMFQQDDGSWSMPMMPRGPSSTLAGGFGFVTCGGTDKTKYRAFATWTNIPIGPPGTKARALLRTDSIFTLEDGVGGNPPPDSLKIIKVINNNTATSYVDYGGDDSSLLADPDKLYLRYDHIMPPPARYIFDFDGRTGHGYGRSSRCAIFLAPTGTTVSGDRNKSIDTDALYAATAVYHYQENGAQLILKKTVSGSTTQLAISAASATLQDIADTINATTTASACGEWRAQVAPGASTESASLNLFPTTTAIGTCTMVSGQAYLTAPTNSAAAKAACAVGVRLYAATGLPAACYVKAVGPESTSTKIYLCNASGAAVTCTANASAAVTAYSDVGDDASVGDATLGNVRVISGSYYGCLYFKNTYFAREPSGKSAVWMTVGGPKQVRQSANAFVSDASNKHIPPGNPGICMGGGGLADGAVILYANERHILRNTRGGRTGLDEDYRLDRATRTGCVSDDSVVVGFGWVGYMGTEGYMACDLSNEINLTRALWDAGSNYGGLGPEISACISGATQDTDSGQMHAAVAGHRLHLSYRSGGTGLMPNRRATMDFGEGSQASGLGQLVSPEGAPWGWSTPLVQAAQGGYGKCASMGFVRRSSGLELYAASSGNYGSMGDGRVDLLDSGSTDNGSAIGCELRSPIDLCETLKYKAVDSTLVKYRGATSGVSAMIVGFTGASTPPSSTIPLVPVANDEALMGVCRQALQWGQAVRGANKAVQFSFIDNSAATPAGEIWGAETTVDILDTYD